jgi:Sec-independent protein translocase protein TatA
MFGTLGIQEILIILVIGVIVFGVIRMPKILRFLGSGVDKFKKVRDTLKNPLDFDKLMDEEPPEDRRYYGPNHSPNDPRGQQWAGGWTNQKPGRYPEAGQHDQWQGNRGQGGQYQDNNPPGESGQSEEKMPPGGGAGST